MKIAIAIPYHSQPGYLQRALESLSKQDSEAWSALVVDDSQSGEAAGLVTRFGDQRIVYHRNPVAQGMVANWIFAVSLVQGPWVTLLHADDELMPHYVSTMLDLISRFRDADMIFCGAEIIDESSRKCYSLADHIKSWLIPEDSEYFSLFGESGARALARGNFIMCPTVCYRREVLLSNPWNAEYKQVQDLELYFRYLLAGRKLAGTRKQAYRYRRHSSNATALATADLSRFTEERRLLAEYADKFASKSWREAADAASRMRIIKAHLSYQILRDLLQGRWRRLRDLLHILRTM